MKVPEPFHIYSMRQAIEEGFIIDVLQNYTTYETFYKVEKSIQDDPEYEVTGLSEVTDPNILYDLQYELNAGQVYTSTEVNQVNELEFSEKINDKRAQSRLNYLLDPQQHASGTAPDEEKERLSIILNQFNERFGTEFDHVDKIMEEMEEGLSENQNVRESGKNNSFDNFKYGFNEEFMDLFVCNIEKGGDYMGILENPEDLGMLQDYLALKIYNRIQDSL
ncbi:MAG TPA: hypothetical protein VFF20_09870 [Pseudogracilibacillus sp.]|nr:hypothetical protein [Pseudogracilibacillus sp.]